MATVNMAKARQLCTASELQLVQESGRNSLGRWSEAELKRKVGQARKLRDKWRDLAEKQRRQTQQAQAARATDKNARSGEKVEIFDAVLQRFQQQLDKVSASGDSASGSGRPSAKKKTAKPKRQAAQRVVRAVTRDALEQKRRKINARSSQSAASAPVDESAAAETPSAPTKKAAKKKTPRSKGPAQPPAKSKGLVGNNPKQQRSAKVTAKQARVKASGLDSRVRGHVSARGKRAQARRDKRG